MKKIIAGLVTHILDYDNETGAIVGSHEGITPCEPIPPSALSVEFDGSVYIVTMPD